ncbi:MAG: hypothetical protein FJ256_06510 [Phycisphaerae bacterium]|nr:hypothetical protein [Phycisphaerae bacterium]
MFTSTNTANPMFDGFTSLWNFDNAGACANATSTADGSFSVIPAAGAIALLALAGRATRRTR